jgi:KUP system potassium uptake protein
MSTASTSTTPTRRLMLGAIGVVYGDIGTSPLYALKETFAGHHPIAVEPATVLGVLSLVFWSIMVLVTLKYVTIIMRADNRGEGGSLALLALVSSVMRGRVQQWGLPLLGIFAAALFFGDSMITPAISVLSAVEGLKVIAPGLEPVVVPVTAGILLALFAIQKNGTAKVGLVFGPVMILWFTTLALLGVIQIAAHPGVLLAALPTHAFAFVSAHPMTAFFALGAVVLAVTGGEALYTDMGHFGRRPIRLSWFGFVMPALLLNYFGQGALLIADPEAIRSPFYLLAPGWALVPMVILATCATVIASQAVISGAFSVARQAVQLGYLPRMTMIHTSGREAGQIYVPFTNWILCTAVLGLVFGFGSSSSLAAAYGIAVTATMMIDTILVGFVMLYLWKWPPLVAHALAGTLIAIDLAFFGSNALKIADGGWFPIVVAIVSFTLLTTWKRGRAQVFSRMKADSIPLEVLLSSIDDILRVSGTAVFMTSDADGTPTALLHNLKHNKVLHDRIFMLTVVTEEKPYVPEAERIEYTDLGHGFYRLICHYGFMQQPDIPAALAACGCHGHTFDMMDTTFYLSREVIVPSLAPVMALWRERLFAVMNQNATPAHEFFRIPTNRVVELGTQLEM